MIFSGCVEEGSDEEEEKGELQVVISGIGENSEIESDESIGFDVIVLDENSDGVSNAKITLTSNDGVFDSSSGLTSLEENKGIYTAEYTAPIVNDDTEVYITCKATKSGYESGKATISIIVVPRATEKLIASLDQGDGNMDEGVLFVLQKGSGSSVKISDYRFKVGEKGDTLFTYKWPNDGNTTAYSIDSGLKSNDGEWWDATERMGFDATDEMKLHSDIIDGDVIEVSIINLDTGDVVYCDEFTYRD
jgi:hypothetical protein